MKQTPKVEYWKDGRYAIVDEDTGEILDDAQGYGYKDKQKATKAMWWKFNGGKEKIDSQKKLAINWLKDEGNKEMYKDLEKILLMNFKEIARGEDTVETVIRQFEEEVDFSFPDYVIKYYLNN